MKRNETAGPTCQRGNRPERKPESLAPDSRSAQCSPQRVTPNRDARRAALLAAMDATAGVLLALTRLEAQEAGEPTA